ncbi:MAG: phospho-N-acetylmuramoyl-pentapeptide-transferase [Deltaproteobacteria bacterium]|nr:phospho-N-acetylmuramoyl-pentapeptide-transferase [Deltaproteobacteria bacterium]
MLYGLLYPLRNEAPWLHFLNVLRYIPFRVIAAVLTAMVIAFALSPWFIRRLQEQQIGQTIREEGPKSHFSKAGTPTMGGSLILLAMVIPTVLWADLGNVFVWMSLAVTVGYGLIGFLDDSLKIRKKSSAGLPAVAKLALQIIIAGVVLYYLFALDSVPRDWERVRLRMALPFVAFDRVRIVLPMLAYVAFAVFVVVSMSNAVNLTDGLDGLAIGPVIINAGTYLLLAYITGATFAGFSMPRYLHIPALPSAGELAVFAGALVGSGIGFLWYNTYPAQVFMGDVGSLALGGALGMMAVLTKNELLSVLLGGIFVIEAVSVVTQVVSFKLTGKRIFRMAPIHHHFELKGWAEPKIIVRFWIISIMLALVSLASLKVR